MRVEAHSESSCSQSFAWSRDRTSVALRVGRDGRATLEVDRESVGQFGPSPGAYMRGERTFDRHGERVIARWVGRASTTAEGLVLTFDEVHEGHARHLAASAPPAPATTRGAADLRVECRVAPADVYPSPPQGSPSLAAPGETATRVPLLRCVFPGGVPPAFGLLAQAGGELVLGARGGVVLHNEHRLTHSGSLLRLP